MTVATDDTDAMRSRLYLLLGRLLAKPADNAVLEIARGLRTDRVDTPLDEALAGLSAAAAETDSDAAARDYHTLFIGIGRGELVPYASWYLTGFIGERPLIRLRDDMAALGIARADGVCEPEDHIAALCEMMAGLVSGAFGEPAGNERQAGFFGTHVALWAPRFFDDLAGNRQSAFYAAVGVVGRRFLDIEAALLLDPAQVRR